MTARQFNYTRSDAFPELTIGLPFVHISLSFHGHSIQSPALVDSGASVSVLPYDIGLQLGLKWDEQKYPVDLTVLLQGTQAYGVVLKGKISDFSEVPLAFAWTRRNDIRLILGQLNFFQQFDVHFHGAENTFEIIEKA